MQKALLGVLLGLLALPATSARATSVCGPGGAAATSRYCSFSSSGLYFGSGKDSPSFAVVRDGRTLAPVLSSNLLRFNATFTGKHSGVASFVEAGSAIPSQPGRQWGRDGDGAGTYGMGVGIFSTYVPDGWYRRPSGDGWGRYHRSWDSGYTGFSTLDPVATPLATTPEPITLVLFGTGLLLIAFLARRRAGSVREDT